MVDATNEPTEGDIRDFPRKLKDFRASLNDNEKSFLDAVTSTAAANYAGDEEVAGFATMAEYGLLLSVIAVVCSPNASAWRGSFCSARRDETASPSANDRTRAPT